MNANDFCAVYAVVNQITGDSYIGSSIRVLSRWSVHKSTIRNGKHQTKRIREAALIYGSEAFTLSILERCTPEDKYVREQHWLDLIKPIYNTIYKASENNKGVTRPPNSEEQKAMISAKLKGNHNTKGKNMGNQNARKHW